MVSHQIFSVDGSVGVVSVLSLPFFASSSPSAELFPSGAGRALAAMIPVVSRLSMRKRPEEPGQAEKACSMACSLPSPFRYPAARKRALVFIRQNAYEVFSEIGSGYSCGGFQRLKL